MSCIRTYKFTSNFSWCIETEPGLAKPVICVAERGDCPCRRAARETRVFGEGAQQPLTLFLPFPPSLFGMCITGRAAPILPSTSRSRCSLLHLGGLRQMKALCELCFLPAWETLETQESRSAVATPKCALAISWRRALVSVCAAQLLRDRAGDTGKVVSSG